MYTQSTHLDKNGPCRKIAQIELSEYSAETLLQSPDLTQEILNYLTSQYAANYFVALALFTKRHIESYLIGRFGGQIIGIMAKRRSGKVHIIGQILEHQEAFEWLRGGQVKALLMQETLLAYIGPSTKINITSSVMQLELGPHSKAAFTRPPDMDDYKLVRLTQDHIPQAIDFYARFMSGSVSKEDMKALLKLGSVAVAYISTTSHEIVALGQVGLWQGCAGILYGILVHPQMRGQGFGRHIVEALLSNCPEGIGQLGLLTNNPVAISLYGTFGFVEKGNLVEATL